MEDTCTAVGGFLDKDQQFFMSRSFPYLLWQLVRIDSVGDTCKTSFFEGSLFPRNENCSTTEPYYGVGLSLSLTPVHCSEHFFFEL